MMNIQNVNVFKVSQDNDSKLIKEYNENGFRIGKTSKIALHVLTVSAAVLTALPAMIACITAAPWTIPVMIVSAVVLSILCLVEFAIAIKPYLHEKLQEVANMVRAFCVDIFALLALGCLYPFSQTWFDPKAEECSKDHTPTLLIHGYLHNSSGWAYFRYRLKLAGQKNIFTIDLGHPFLSMEDYVKKVAAKIKEIQELTGRKDIKLIGHSMGGIIASYLATHMESSKVDVKSVITLGSPLNGTCLHGLGLAAKQMHCGSSFVKKLRENILESEIPFYHIGSENDEIIKPSNSTVMEENKHTVFNNLGHASYLFSDRVIRHCLSYYNKLADEVV
jgi:predicted alpha/beta hydrolase family esterase